MMRQSQHKKKKLPDNFAAWTSECSYRASIAPAGWTCGRLTKGGWAGGPDGTYRDHWCSQCRKKPFSRVIFVLGAMLNFQHRSSGDPQFVRVILAPKPCNFFFPYRGQENSGTRGAPRPALPFFFFF